LKTNKRQKGDNAMSKENRKKRRSWGMFFAGDCVINIRNGFAATVMPAHREEVPAGHVPIKYVDTIFDLDYDYVPGDDLDQA